ncbi:MAG: type III-A CRISPR-associated protein Cas10/Csm1, partial [Pseudoleptotrichia goodfellowii]|nr:type III-A CRISPR-associated protein Cas10/Csm1 [Pseudoleptotrichia goodfellowii]
VEDIEDDKLRRVGRIVARADNYSAKERRNEQIEPKIENEKIREDMHWQKKPLNSVFETISIRKENLSENNMEYAYKLGIINPENIFPSMLQNKEGNDKIKGFSGNEDEELYKHINEFLQEVKEIEAENYETFYTHLYSLLEKYTWCIASDTQTRISDISLFDHLRSTAALALSSYKYHMKNDKLPTNIVRSGAEQFLIIVGDVSGIQTFIYDEIKSDGAAKTLRGKSFFVKMISDAISLKIIKELGLDITNIILTAGGKFYIIAPNTKETVDKIENIKESLNNYLYENFFGQLFVNIVMLPANGDQIAGEFNKKIDKANRELNKSKNERFFGQIRENPVFEMGYGNIIQNEENEIENSKLGILNKKFSDIGGKLPKAEYIGIIYDSEEISNETYEIIKGVSIQFFESEEEILKSKNISLVFSLNEPRIVKNYPTIFRFISNYAPTKENGKTLKSFNEIAETATGNKKIAVYKADVDNLGMIFSIGLKGNFDIDKFNVKNKNQSEEEMEKENKALDDAIEKDDKNKDYGNRDSIDYRSLSRIATLSRNMEYFFSYWMNKKFSEENKFKNVYVLYSGGDDLVIIGAWDKIIEAAGFITENFEKYVTENDNITISGGISLLSPKQKIIQGIKEAGEAEEISKEYECVINGKSTEKNALTVFGRSLNWQKYENIFNFAKELLELTSEQSYKIFSQAFLYRSHNYVNMAESFWNKKSSNVELLTYMSKFEYDYGRNLKDKIEKIEKDLEKNKVKDIKQAEKTLKTIEKYRNYFTEEMTKDTFINNYMNIVLNYVIYANRKNNNGEVE